MAEKTYRLDFALSDGSTKSVEFSVPQGADGRTPVKGVDYWTAADQESIVQQVIAALGTPVFGTVDAENNIILTGELADGTYTLKYEDADGNLAEIGTIEVGGITDESGPIAIEWAGGTKIDKNTGALSVTNDSYGASQLIPYDSNYTYTVTSHDTSASNGAACWYDASGGYLGWNDAIKSGGATTGTLTPMDGAASFRLRWWTTSAALRDGYLAKVTLRKDLNQ